MAFIYNIYFKQECTVVVCMTKNIKCDPLPEEGQKATSEYSKICFKILR